VRLELGCVDEDLGVRAGVAVVVRGERQIVARHEVFDEDPGRMRLGQRDVACFDQRGGGGFRELFPSGRRFDTGGFERVDVVVHDRRGRVEGHADHLVVAVGIEVAHTGNVVFDVEVDAVLGHQILHGDGRTHSTDHGGCSGVEDLQDVGMFTGTECRDSGSQGFFVGALEDRRDLVVGLAGVEVGGDLVERVAQGTAHGVPPRDFGLCGCGTGRHRQRGGRGK